MASILNVDQINNAAGTTALKINTDGVVTNPQKPYVSVELSGALGYVSHNADDAVKFSAVESGDSSLFDTTTHKFTCPVDGVYIVNYQLLIPSSSTVTLWFMQNSTKVSRSYQVSSRAGKGSYTYLCSANDELYLQTETANSFYNGTGDARYSWATFTLIG